MTNTYCVYTWAVQKVSDVIFSAETNEAWEVCCGREVEGTLMHICGFFPTSRQRQSRAASVWVTVHTQRTLHCYILRKWLCLGFWVVPVNPWLITSGHMFRNLGSLFAESSMSCATSRRSCFCSIISSFGRNFADILCKAKSLVTMECTEPVLIPPPPLQVLGQWHNSPAWPKSTLGQWTCNFGLSRTYRNKCRSPPTCSHLSVCCTTP